jgi:GNAT superfamily N-acetyltransferase
MAAYRVRPATLDDVDALVHHRIGMFSDMGTSFDVTTVENAFRAWLAEMMPAGTYRTWVVETEREGPADRLREGHGSPPERDAFFPRAKVEAEHLVRPGKIVAGGGITIVPWPPGPSYVGGRIAFVYNVYTERSHRRLGLARLVMEAIHAWCRENGIGVVGLNASPDGRHLYEAMGYQPAPSPLMFAAVDVDDSRTGQS